MAESPVQPSPSPRVLVIVPAYNEAMSIGAVVTGLRRCVAKCDVLVVDDGSTDGTAEQVPEDAVVIRLPFNLGIGAAMQTGYRYAALRGYDVAVQVDADGQHLPDQVDKLLSRLAEGDVDMVIGSRFLEPAGYDQAPSRMAGMRLLGILIRGLTGKMHTDCTSGFRAVNRAVIEAFAHWYPEDYPEPEVVLLLDREGYRIAEVQVDMEQRATGQTSIPFHVGLFYVLKVSTSLLLDTIRTPWPRRKGPSS